MTGNFAAEDSYDGGAQVCASGAALAATVIAAYKKRLGQTPAVQRKKLAWRYWRLGQCFEAFDECFLGLHADDGIDLFAAFEEG